MKLFLIILLVITTTLVSGQETDRTINEQRAKEAVSKVINDKNNEPFYDTLIADKTTAIAVVEPILFKIYGKKNIISERPYECYLINGYWYISGTLPKGWRGGVFEIIVSSKDGKVIKLIHGQ